MKKAVLFGVLGVILAGLTSCSGILGGTPQQEMVVSTDSKEINTPAPTTETVNAMSTARNSINAQGQVTATIVRKITVDFPAVVETVSVNEGQRVKKGDSLLTLNMIEFEEQIRSTELELLALKSDISRVREKYVAGSSSPEVKMLLNDLANAEDNYSKAQKDLGEKQKLYEAGNIAKSELEQLKKTVAEARKTADNIKLSIESLKAGKRTQMEIDTLQVTKLESGLRIMKDKLKKPYLLNNEIICDLDHAAVFDIDQAAGDILAANTKVLSLMDLDSLVVRAEVPEKYIADIKTGAAVVIVPRSDSSRQYQGKITRISGLPVAKEEEAFVPVDIAIENRDDFLLPNGFVDVKIKIQ